MEKMEGRVKDGFREGDLSRKHLFHRCLFLKNTMGTSSAAAAAAGVRWMDDTREQEAQLRGRGELR